MVYYPVFLDLRDREVLVVGGGKVALRKVQGLVEAGARVTVVSPEARAEFTSLGIKILRRKFRRADVRGQVLVFAATDDRRVNGAVGLVAAAQGIPVNVVDSREECTFIVPARVRRGGVQIAVSSGGRSPRLAAELRKKIDVALG